MKELIDRKVNIIGNIKIKGSPITGECSLKNLVAAIKSGGNSLEKIKQLRAINRKENEEAYNSLKTTLSAYSFASFSDSKCIKENWISSGMLPMDVDHLNPEEKHTSRKKLEADPHVLLLHESPGAEGLKFVVVVEAIEEVEEYRYIYEQVREHYEKLIGHKLDNNVDPRRLTFVSFDPKCYCNTGAIPFTNLQSFPVVSEMTDKTYQSLGIPHISMLDVCSKYCIDLKQKGNTYVGVFPGELSKSKSHFRVSADGNAFYCFHNQRGSRNPLYLIALLEKIINWSDVREGGLKGKQFVDTCKAWGIEVHQKQGSEFYGKSRPVETPAEWEPIEIETEPENLPAFPLECLPAIVSQMAIEISETVKTPTEVAALGIMTALASCFGNRIYTQIEPVETRTNIYSIVFQARGERKSTVYNKIVAPIYDWISRQQESYNKAIYNQGINAKRLAGLESSLIAPKKGESLKDLEYERDALRAELEHNTPLDPMFITGDATNAALRLLLKRTDGKGAIFSDDARDMIQILLGIYTGGQTQEHIFTKTYLGKLPLDTTRKADDGLVLIENPCFNIFLMTQTDVIKNVAETGSFLDSGFLSRIELCYPESLVGKKDSEGNLVRAFDNRKVNPEVYSQYSNLINELLDEYYNNTEVRYHPIDEDAKATWIKFYNEIEEQSGEDGLFEDKLDYSIRLQEKALKYAHLFSLIERRPSITAGDVTNGVYIALYYSAHADKILRLVKHRTIPQDCRKILRHIQAGTNIKNPFTFREVLQYCHFKKEVAVVALSFLESKNYIRALPEIRAQHGQKKTVTYEVNPEFYQLKGAF
ncbi:MAG: hypothetical protein A2X47_10915 [Lentisphaerae bacterium GWF2_38_69]|nr:MAG: hypothetical protein A2X47_10915 [Lentisphaerae bacterium GWF2_38_69]